MRVPRFEPFAALRFSPTLSLDDVAAPPYDVLSDADVDALLARHPRNIVAIDVPREADGPRRYEQAAQRLADWVADGSLVRDPSPSFTLYRMKFTDEAGTARETVGVLGALEVVDEGADGVLPHERTTPKAKSDRLDLTRATNTNLSPVWGLSLTARLTDLLREPAEPMGSCHDEHGVLHSVERVTDPERVAAIGAAVSSHAVLIADGHHRYAISRTFREEVRAANAGDAGTAELTLAYVAELVDDQLSIDAIHRVYHGVTAEQLLDVLRTSFDVEDAGPVTPAFATEVVDRGALCMVRPDGTGVWLTPKPAVFADVRALDGAYLEHALREHDLDVTYQHGVQQVVDAVAAHSSVAVLIRPTSIVEIRRTADERLLMPPKSTFFTPKLRTGPVLRPLD
ncbi:MAG: hypothetical protein RJA49_1317 [Actinomycetota bacterium]